MADIPWLAIASGLAGGAAETYPGILAQQRADKEKAKREALQRTARTKLTSPDFLSRFRTTQPEQLFPSYIELSDIGTQAGIEPSVLAAMVRSMTEYPLTRERGQTARDVAAANAGTRQPPAPRPYDPSLAISRFEDPKITDPGRRRLVALEQYGLSGSRDLRTGEPLDPNLVQAVGVIRPLMQSDPARALAKAEELLSNQAWVEQVRAQPDGPLTLEYLEGIRASRSGLFDRPIDPRAPRRWF